MSDPEHLFLLDKSDLDSVTAAVSQNFRDFKTLMANQDDHLDDTKRGLMLAAAVEKAVGEMQGLVPLHYEVSTWAMRKGITYRPRTDQ